MKTLGVIGGLGPMATAYFLRRIVEMTDARTDQEHLDVNVLNRPSIPDRTAYILDRTKPSPLPPIVDAAKTLEQLGACCIAIPCITSHALFSEFSAAVGIPFIHILRETATHLKENGVAAAGILATTGTVRASLFQDALAEQGIRCILPDGANQQRVMSLIYDDYKAGRPLEWEKFQLASDFVRRQGAECIVLGCTELSLIKRDRPVGPGVLDALDVLARASIKRCGKPLRPAYEQLITRA